MKKNYTIALFLCTFLGISAQETEVVWQRDIKSSTQDFLSQVTRTIDGQYLITGSSIQGDPSSDPGLAGQKQNNGYDFHLVKLNQQGEEVFEKYFSGQNHDYLSSAVTTEEGGFLISGTTFSGKGLDKKEDSKGGSDIWLIRLNEFGDELWQKTLGSSSDEEAKAVIQTTDLGFFVAGSFVSAQDSQMKGYGSKDVFITKLDKDGKELSQLILGGYGLDEVEKMIPTRDGGALLGVYSRSGIGGSKKTGNYGEGDFWVIKLDKNLKVQWEKNLGGKDDDHIRTLALTSTGYVIGGESRSERSGNKTVGIEEGTDLWIISLDQNGNEEFQKSYNFGGRDVLMGMSVVSGKSNGILMGGYTQAEGRIQTDDETFWLLYIDQLGNEQWRKYITGESRQKEERLAAVALGRDGSIVLAGTSAQELGMENWKIIKLGVGQVSDLLPQYDIKIYPNPVSDFAYIDIGFTFKTAEVKIYDMSGRELQNIITPNKVTKLNTQSLIQGIYLVTVKADNNKTANAKLIKK